MKLKSTRSYERDLAADGAIWHGERLKSTRSYERDRDIRIQYSDPDA